MEPAGIPEGYAEGGDTRIPGLKYYRNPFLSSGPVQDTLFSDELRLF